MQSFAGSVQPVSGGDMNVGPVFSSQTTLLPPPPEAPAPPEPPMPPAPPGPLVEDVVEDVVLDGPVEEETFDDVAPPPLVFVLVVVPVSSSEHAATLPR
jgi:hypothetical protein